MQDLHTLIETSVTQLGYELVDLEVSNRGKLLRVFIDKLNPVDAKDSVNIDDCSLVSNQLGNLLAVENDIDYDRLEVSSPGMDRVLKNEANFMRFIGERATVKLRVPVIELLVNAKDKKEEKISKKNYLGLIRGVESSQLLLECDGIVHRIAISNIEKSRLSPVF
ncbi:MAG: ribosome maturation factor RimP [Methylotenera sp.]|nr:ribosome maturation factor RimP [Methylotenera sp.]MSQ00152.1 ribosome maturation factor RimP [Methylotenera sp.]